MVTVKIEGMRCGGCAMGVEAALSKLDFVKDVHADHERGVAEIECEGEPNMKKIASAVKKAGFKVVD